MSCLVSFALNKVRCEEHGASENYKMKNCISRGVMLEIEMHCSERNVPINIFAEFIFRCQVQPKTYVASFRSRRMLSYMDAWSRNVLEYCQFKTRPTVTTDMYICVIVIHTVASKLLCNTCCKLVIYFMTYSIQTFYLHLISGG